MTGRHIGYSVSTVPRRRAVGAVTAPSQITTTRRLLTDSWTSDVGVLEAAVARFGDRELVTNDCRVAFFEIASDDWLHVNVTHTHLTLTPAGWSGPGTVAGGFVHNRRFGNMTAHRIAQHIHDMVFAARSERRVPPRQLRNA